MELLLQRIVLFSERRELLVNVRRTDSPYGFTGHSYPTLAHTNFEGKR